MTLTGPGGVGKTRLAIETAAQSAAAFPDGTWLVEMAGPRPPRPLPADEVMSVMGIRNDSSISSADLLGDALRDSRLLLVLDNCEHLIGQVAKLATQLLQSAPELRVMVTSREPLMIAGEVIWAVPPLDLPDPDAEHEPAALARFSSVRLFTMRAEASAPGFRLDEGNAQAVAALCRRLDGIPLALELAATRVRTLGVHELLARLDDRFRLLATGHRDAPPRQQTLWGVIDWSWELLTEPERIVLRRLAVLADGCELRAAEAICGEDELDVLGLLSRLVDRSLVVVAGRRPGSRTARATVAGERGSLQPAPPAGGRRVPSGAAAAPPVLRRSRRARGDAPTRATTSGPGSGAWTLRRPTCTPRSVPRPTTVTPPRSGWPTRWPGTGCSAASWRGHGALWRRHLPSPADQLPAGHGPRMAQRFRDPRGGALGPAAPPLDEIDDPGTRALLQWFHAFVASDFGDPSAAEAMLGDALASFRAIGDQWGIAAALSTRAKLAMIRGDKAATQRLAQQSLAMFRELGDRWGQLQAIEWLGAAVAPVDRARAERLHRDGLRMAEQLGLWPQAADALSWLGRSALRAGDLGQARELLQRGMRLAAEQSYQPGQVFAELGLAQTARKDGKLDCAEAHLRSVLRASERTGSEPDVARVAALSELGFIDEQRGEPTIARSYHLRSLAEATKLGDPQAVAQALTGLAGVQALGGQAARRPVARSGGDCQALGRGQPSIR